MDITTATHTATKSPEPEIKTQPRIKPTPTATPTKPISFTNGVLKRHHHAPGAGAAGFIYKECLKNHAASLGGYALDGCGEFMPAPTATSSDPTSLKCAACGCHRNFHRRELDDLPAPVIEYHPHHRHHPLPPPPPTVVAPGGSRSPGSQSPPPISSSYYPGSAPHMLLALSEPTATPNLNPSSNSSKKRFRTKFSQHQKDKMYELAERVGWKMHKSNEDLVNGLCREIGVERGVFKVWMHNNKNTFGKRSGNSGANNLSIEHGNGNGNGNGNGISHSTSSHNNEETHHHHLQQQRQLFGSNESNAPTNGSSSSS